jgi:hypothetical protein
MLTSVNGYWLEVVTPASFVIEFTSDPFPPGTNVYANISLSDANNYFEDASISPRFVATGYIEWWTVYQADGTESAPYLGMGFNQNAVAVNNCVRIRFALVGFRVSATAQVNIFTYQ